MRVLFFGTPQFGADVLSELLQSNHQVVAVVCQTDKPGNRNKLEACEVKIAAMENCIPVYQFVDVNEATARLKQLSADVFVTAAYGQILAQAVIDIPKHGILNVHPSVLPKYRGPAPVQFALLNGDKTTGVSIAKTVLKLDSGDVLAQQEIEISEDDNNATLLKKTARFGGRILVTVLDEIDDGYPLEATPQDDGIATYTSKITTDICRIDWSETAEAVCHRIRAFAPVPAAFTTLGGQILKIFEAEPISLKQAAKAGAVVECNKNTLTVACGSGGVSLKTLQLAGGKIVSYKDLINGRKIAAGDILA